jgi:hypothetical protein
MKLKKWILAAGVAAMMMSVSCSDDDVDVAAYVKDKEQDPAVVGYWIGFEDAEIKTINGKLVLIMSDTSTIYPSVSQYVEDGSDFAYALKKENGHFIHSYDPSTKISLNYWYTGPSTATESVLYEVYSIDGKNISTTIDFDYMEYNTDTLIINDRTTDKKRVLVRVADPSNIPSTLKIKE